MQFSIPVRTSPTNLTFKHNQIMIETIIINVLIIVLVFISQYSFVPAAIGGFSIILYLTMTALTRPAKSFFLIFGIKLTFDALWFLKLPFPEYERFKLLELFMIPMIFLVFVGPKLSRQSLRWPIWCSLFYVLWVILAMLLNGNDLDLSLLIRQSGIFLGLFIGLKYLKDEEYFSTLIYMMFISTIIPMLASLVQIIVGPIGIPIFHYKLDSIREYRYSGLYYDPATAGMVSVISLLCNTYLISSGIVKRFKS